jgi:hypothetical protein
MTYLAGRVNLLMRPYLKVDVVGKKEAKEIFAVICSWLLKSKLVVVVLLLATGRTTTYSYYLLLLLCPRFYGLVSMAISYSPVVSCLLSVVPSWSDGQRAELNRRVVASLLGTGRSYSYRYLLVL